MNAAIAQLEIRAERERQVEMLGYTAERDDQYGNDELLSAAICYFNFHDDFEDVPADWPWSIEAWKPKDRARNLIKAGALVLAEMDRCERLGEGRSHALMDLFDRIDRALIGTR